MSVVRAADLPAWSVVAARADLDYETEQPVYSPDGASSVIFHRAGIRARLGGLYSWVTADLPDRIHTDHEVQRALDGGGQVLRYGGPETAKVSEQWAVRMSCPDGDRYTETGDREHAEIVADSVATHLAEVAAGRDRPARGPEVTGTAVVVREVRTFPDGSEHHSGWRHVRDGQPIEDSEVQQ